MATPKPKFTINAGGGDYSGVTSGASAQANGGTSQFNPLLGNTAYSQTSVNMGGSYHLGVGYGTNGGFGAKNNQQMPYSDAALAVTQWGEPQLRDFVNRGIINKVPGFEPGMGMPQIQAAWQNMVQASVLFNSQAKPGDKQWTPFDVLNSWSDAKGTGKGSFGTKRDGDWLYDVATGERIKYVGPRSKTVTSKKVDLSSAADVKAIATQALRELLGRAPTAEEFAKFRGAINSEEKGNPLVTKTTQQLSPDLASGSVDVTSESSTTSGGVSDAARAALISAPTQKTKEYGKYQSGTTYWDAMMQMIAGGS